MAQWTNLLWGGGSSQVWECHLASDRMAVRPPAWKPDLPSYSLPTHRYPPQTRNGKGLHGRGGHEQLVQGHRVPPHPTPTLGLAPPCPTLLCPHFVTGVAVSRTHNTAYNVYFELQPQDETEATRNPPCPPSGTGAGERMPRSEVTPCSPTCCPP